MQIQSDHKALIFLGVVAVLGAGVRVVRAASSDRPSAQPALEHQMSAADSSARAQNNRQSGGGQRGRGGGARRAAGGRNASDTVRRATKDSSRKLPQPVGMLDRPGYIGSRLDLDVASAAQIDSLPGITPTMAKRIVSDRMQRGPFLTLQGLRRVSGAGDKFLHNIDTLVTFSGTIRSPTSSDTAIARPKNTRAARPAPPTRPVALRRAGPPRAPWRRANVDSCSRAPGRLALPPRAT